MYEASMILWTQRLARLRTDCGRLRVMFPLRQDKTALPRAQPILATPLSLLVGIFLHKRLALEFSTGEQTDSTFRAWSIIGFHLPSHYIYERKQNREQSRNRKDLRPSLIKTERWLGCQVGKSVRVTLSLSLSQTELSLSEWRVSDSVIHWIVRMTRRHSQWVTHNQWLWVWLSTGKVMPITYVRKTKA